MEQKATRSCYPAKGVAHEKKMMVLAVVEIKLTEIYKAPETLPS